MAELGLFFAVTADLGSRVREQAEAEAAADLMDHHHAELDAAGWAQSTEEAWDAIHRCLTDGTLRYGDDVAHSCVLGTGWFRCESEGPTVNVLDADEVREAAAYLRGIDETALRARYAGIDRPGYRFHKPPADFEYVWHWFVQLRAFYRRAAEAERWVVFVADQARRRPKRTAKE